VTDLLQAIILGIVQGLTEFLPVSSSGHLEIAKFLLNDPDIGERSLLFTIIVHFATALSTVFIFRKDIAEIIRGLFQREWNEAKRFSVNIVISMIPASLAGFLLEPWIAALFEQRIAFVGAMLLVTAILLFVADRVRRTSVDTVGWNEAIVIGFAQAVAILPGISRSGATIATSIMLGVERYKASRFSFLMVVPLIFGKIAYDLIDGELYFSQGELSSVTAAFIAAFVSGALACKWMVALVQRSQLTYFAVYCICIGIFAIAMAIS
jgi:undecaprenyl-diphosphatase